MSLSSSGDHVRLLYNASSPSAQQFAMSINYEIVLGLTRSSSSMNSRRRRPSLKASMALSSDMDLTVFFMMFHRWINALIDSPSFCLHARNFSMDAGHLNVD